MIVECAHPVPRGQQHLTLVTTGQGGCHGHSWDERTKADAKEE